jgi:hypothetical protein
MTRLPKKRGITQVEEDKSLILRQNVGNSPIVKTMRIRAQNWLIRSLSLHIVNRKWLGTEKVNLSVKL